MAAETAANASIDTPTEPIPIEGRDELDDVTAEYDVVLADVHAEWCGPCQQLEPIGDRLATETNASVAKIDIDENQQLARTYGVRGVPTLALFAEGEQVEKVVGVQSEEQLRSLIEQYTE